MVSDSITIAPIAQASSNPKDIAKKKRGNRSAKLKQYKLDARREQWLSQVKSKGGCEEELCGGVKNGDSMPLENNSGLPIEKLEIKPKHKEEIYVDISSMHHYSDFESSPSNSPTSHSSSILCSNHSGVSFTESSRGSSSSGRSSSSRSNGCFSVSMSDEDEGNVDDDDDDDDCLDDWEAMADALDLTEDKQQEHGPSSECLVNDVPNAKQESGATSVQRSSMNRQAWRADDAFRPQSLPNLPKQYSFPLSSVWGCKNIGVVPTSCPICCEDLDCTDSSFLPCLCGFRLCLFCHKRILEEDGRCPGCRKLYNCEAVEGEAATRLARSFSMVTRS